MNNSEKVINKTIPFTVASKRIKVLGISLIKELKGLYTGNWKTLLKEIKEDINKWEAISCSWIKITNFVKLSIFPRVIHIFSEIPNKILIFFFFGRSTKSNPKIDMASQSTVESLNNLEKEQG